MDKMPVVEEYVEEIVNEETGETNPNFEYDDEVDEVPQLPSPKAKMSKEEIFDLPMVKDDKLKEQLKKDAVKPVKKKRPPMTEEHKAKLKQAREKALATRRRNAQEKKEMKELEKRAKQKKKDDLKKYVEGNEKQDEPKQIIKEVIKEPVYQEPVITKKDLEEAQLDAIMKYEAMRKQRKKEKQDKLKEEAEKEKVKKQLDRMVGKQPVYYGQSNYFDNCF